MQLGLIHARGEVARAARGPTRSGPHTSHLWLSKDTVSVSNRCKRKSTLCTPRAAHCPFTANMALRARPSWVFWLHPQYKIRARKIGGPGRLANTSLA